MGTSSTYGGPSNGLEPSWLDDLDSPDSAGDGDTTDGGSSDADQAQPALNTPGLSRARGDLTRFARSGDERHLSNAVNGYLASAGGARRAARRMPNSTRLASGLAGLSNRFSSAGATEALRHFNLDHLAGRPATEVFDALIDELCPNGGTIDEAIARDSMIEAVAGLTDQDFGNFNELTAEQLNEFLMDVITGCVTTKVINEIGTNSLHGSASDADFRAAESTIKDYTSGAVRDAFERSFIARESLNSSELEQRINSIFTNTFEILQAMLETD